VEFAGAWIEWYGGAHLSSLMWGFVFILFKRPIMGALNPKGERQLTIDCLRGMVLLVMSTCWNYGLDLDRRVCKIVGWGEFTSWAYIEDKKVADGDNKEWEWSTDMDFMNRPHIVSGTKWLRSGEDRPGHMVACAPMYSSLASTHPHAVLSPEPWCHLLCCHLSYCSTHGVISGIQVPIQL